MAVPNSFATATSAIPLANLDANFAYYDAAYSISSTTITFLGAVNIGTGTVTIGNGTFSLNQTTAAINLGTSQTTSVITMGGTAGTGAILLGRSTGAQTVSLAGGATTSGTTKTVDIGTAGVSGSITNVNIGSAVSGSTGTTRLSSPSIIFDGSVTSANIAFTLSGTTSNLSLNAGQTTGTIVVGGTAGTGAITVGQSTAAQILNFGTGATANATTKTVNIGTAGVSGSTTNINIGSAVAGSLGTINLQSNTTVAAGYTFTLGAGTASLPPIKFTAGVLDTTPEAGAWNYDGNVFYANNDLTSGRGLVAVSQIFRLAADGAAIGPTIANIFGATSGKSLDTSTFYEVEYCVQFTKTTAGTVTFTMTFSNAPIFNTASYNGSPVGGVGTVGAPQTAAIVKSTATAGALPATGSLTTGVNHYYTIKAVFQSNATTGGTLNLQATSSAGTITPLAGSYYKVTRLPSANTGSFV